MTQTLVSVLTQSEDTSRHIRNKMRKHHSVEVREDIAELADAVTQALQAIRAEFEAKGYVP